MEGTKIRLLQTNGKFPLITRANFFKEFGGH